MADTIRLKRSEAAGSVPAPSQLELGELAVNVADGRIYLKKADGTIVATAMKVEFDAHVGSGGGSHALATPSVAGFMAAADKAKLNGVQNAATANSPDATLLNRANHTGTQPASTITGLGAGATRPVQSGLHARADDGNTLALAGAFGFGGNPFQYGAGTTAAQTLDPYGLTRVFRLDADVSGSGFSTFSPVLHLGGIDTWSRFQIDYSSGIARYAHGLAGTQYASGQFWSTANFNPYVYSTTAEMQAAIAAAKPAPVLEIATSTTLNLSHANQFLWSTTSSALTITVPANSSVAFPVGAEIHLGAFTAGSLTLSAAGGVILDLPNGGSAVLGPNMNATLKKMQTNRWRLIGQTVAA